MKLNPFKVLDPDYSQDDKIFFQLWGMETDY